MQPEQRDRAYLWDMLQAARAVRSFIEDRTFAEYEEDLLLRSGVERQIEIIGEAANKVSAALQAATSDIPWRGIIAQRHVLAHEYGDIKHERIWLVAHEYIPELIVKLETFDLTPPQSE